MPHDNNRRNFQESQHRYNTQNKIYIHLQNRNLVYLIQCRKCGLQYVGETANPLHIRMNDHRSDIHTQETDKPVAAHFNLPDHTLDDLQVMGIKKIHNNDTEWRKHRESYWIFTLDILAPTGMNLED